MSDFMDGSFPTQGPSAGSSLLAIHFDTNGAPDAAVSINGPYITDRYSMFAGPQHALLSQSNASATDLAMAALAGNGAADPHAEYYGFGSAGNMTQALARIIGQELQHEMKDLAQLGAVLEQLGSALAGDHDGYGASGASFFQSPAFLLENVLGHVTAQLGENLEQSANGLERALSRSFNRGLAWKNTDDTTRDANDLVALSLSARNIAPQMRQNTQDLINRALEKTLENMSPQELGQFASNLNALPLDVRTQVEEQIQKSLEKTLKDASPSEIMSLLKDVKNMPPELQATVVNIAAEALKTALASAGGKEFLQTMAAAEKLPPTLRNEIEPVITKALEEAMKKMTPEQLGQLLQDSEKLPADVKQHVQDELVVAFFHLIDETRDPERLQQLFKALGNAPPAISDKIASAMAKALNTLIENADPQTLMSLMKSLGKLPPQLLAKILPLILGAMQKALARMSPDQLEGLLAQASSLPPALRSMLVTLIAAQLMKDGGQANGKNKGDSAKNAGRQLAGLASAAAGRGSNPKPNDIVLIGTTQQSRTGTDVLLIAGTS